MHKREVMGLNLTSRLADVFCAKISRFVTLTKTGGHYPGLPELKKIFLFGFVLFC